MDKNQIIHAAYKKHKLLVVFIVMLLCSVSTSRAIHFLSVSSSFVSRYKHELDFVKYLIIIGLLLLVERPFSLVRREGGERSFLMEQPMAYEIITIPLNFVAQEVQSRN